MGSSSVDTPIGLLLQTAVLSILQISLQCFAGYVLARRGILNKATQKQINLVNIAFFTPALLFSKVAFFLTPDKLRELWIMPIVFIVITFGSMFIARIFGWIFRLKPTQRNFAVATAMFMNSNSLPVALMQSLVTTVPGLKWGEDDNEDAMLGRALAYLLLFYTIAMLVRWSYGVKLLSQPDDELEISRTIFEDREDTPLLFSGHEERNTPHEYSSLATNDLDDDTEILDETSTKPHSISGKTASAAQAHPLSSNWRSPSPSNAVMSSSLTDLDSESDDDEHLPTLQNTRTQSTPRKFQPLLIRSRRRIFSVLSLVNKFMTAPLWASLASLIVASIPSLQHILGHPLLPFRGALNTAGNCSVPLTLVVLGAYFHDPTNEPKQHNTTSMRTPPPMSFAKKMRGMFSRRLAHEGRPKAPDEAGETRAILVALLSRMIVPPFLLVPLIALCVKFKVEAIFMDPVFVVCMVLLTASPPATTLAQIVPSSSVGTFERLLSRTMFWSYCVLTPPTTILYVVLGLVLSKL